MVKPIKVLLLTLVVISQVFYVEYVILPNRELRLQLESTATVTNPPPGYRVLTDGKDWVWEHNFSELTNNWYRELQIHSTRQEALDSAWFQYNFELQDSTNKWVVKP